MRYQFELTIPENTPSGSPAELEAVMDVGTITRALIRFRAGPHNRVRVTASDGLHRIIPASPDESLYGNDVIYDIPLDLELFDSPFSIMLRGWSPGTVYPHTVTFWFDLQPPDGSRAPTMLEQLLHLGGVKRLRS